MARPPASRARRIQRLNDLLEPYSDAMRAAFLASISDVVSNASIDVAIRALEQGNIDAAVSALNISRAAFNPVDQAFGGSFNAGGTASASALSASAGQGVVIRFDGRNPIAEQWLAEYSGQLIKSITDDQLLMARNHMRESLMAGAGPRSVITDLVGAVDKRTRARTGGLLGLTDFQAQLVRNAERQLRSGLTADLRAYLARELRDKRYDRSVLRAIRTGEPLEPDLIARIMQSYKNRFLAYRAETIARTETMTALHQAQYLAARQALLQNPDIKPHMIRRVWRTAMDKAVRDSHSDMEGQTVGLEESFTSGKGVPLRFPGDPDAPADERINCRCDVFLRIDYLSNFGPTPTGPGAPAPAPPSARLFPAERILYTGLGVSDPDTPNPPESLTIDPKHFQKMFAAFSGDEKSKLVITIAQRGIETEMFAPGKAKVERFFSFDDQGRRNVDHVYFKLDSGQQGGSFAKQFLRDSMDAYQDMGVSRITLDANIDVGGYAWARYGFVPTEESWKELAQTSKAFMHFGGSALDPDARATVMSILNSQDPRSIWMLSDLTIPYDDRYANTLGKKMLLGSNWSGYLDLSDAEQMARFNAYVNRD